MRQGRGLAGVGIAAMAVVFAWTGLAAATCGDTTHSPPKKTVNPEGRPPIVLGDSVMVFAVPGLAKHGYRANAQECRQWLTGVGLIQRKRDHHRLPHLFVLALGTNGPVTKPDLRAALKALPKNKVLGVVTPRGSVAGDGAENMRWAQRRHPHRVVLLDWVRYSAGHGSDWFAGDGLHLTPAGADAYARFISKALPWAHSGRFPHGVRFPP